MSEIKDGGSAFPTKYQNIAWFDDDGKRHAQIVDASAGMSLRDWFAGQALAGMVNKPRQNPEFYAAEAYCIADALLEARKR